MYLKPLHFTILNVVCCFIKNIFMLMYFCVFHTDADDTVTTGGAQPCHDVETLPNQTFITST